MRVFYGLLLAVCSVALLCGAEHKGQVLFGGLPLPGATVTASRDGRQISSVSDQMGNYLFPELADGAWKVKVEMLCFQPSELEVVVAAAAPASAWELALLPLDVIQATATPVVPSAPPPAPSVPTPVLAGKNRRQNQTATASAAPPQRGFQRTGVNAAAAPGTPAPAAAPASDAFAGQSQEDLSQRATDGFLINGSANNGAASPFSLSNAFGNGRRAGRSLYNGGVGFIFDNSALDAQSYSLTGQRTEKPGYNRLQGVANFGGPLKIPHILKNGPQMFVGFQWIHNRNASTQTGLVPTVSQRLAATSAVAKALLGYYPLPNFTSGTQYNYQTAVLGATDQDGLQSRASKNLGTKDTLAGTFAFQLISQDTVSLFGFEDHTAILGLNTGVTWMHRFGRRGFATLGYQYSHMGSTTTPYFAGRTNVSGLAGISGNDQSSGNWGPPSLVFANGITSLSDAQASATRNQTSAITLDIRWNRTPHSLSFGGDFRRQQLNTVAQQNARGTFTFTGSGLTGFLAGIPDTVSIAYGNADKYFRANSWDAFFNDDWRMSPGFTLNAGIRWEYNSPMTERYGRLVNLAIGPGFSTATPVVGGRLINPNRSAFQPRLGFAWRPMPASSTIVRGGYGLYYNTSVYQTIASQMAQQSPLSRSFNIQNNPANPLTLANAFNATLPTTANTFGIDPNFRVGYAQNWQLSVQQDLPGSLVMTATYLGIKGTREVQQFLPNTFPAGAANPCLLCPTGFTYMTSNGNSTRQSGQLQLRRRLHNGFTATVDYTYAKAIDNAALGTRGQGSAVVAQNWLDLNGERGLSSFDQRHVLAFQTQYTTGMGIGGGTLLSGWRGTAFKEWTVTSEIKAATGLPLTPVYLAAVRGTGVTGTIRPDYTGAALYDTPPGLFLNPAAFAAPAAGKWGNAGRNSITGPGQFTLNASLGRTFRLTDRWNMELRVDATNPLNNVRFPSWNTQANSVQFGAPTAANPMRSLQTTLRLRF